MNSNQKKSAIELLARTGFFAKGVVYVTIGVLASLYAFDSGGAVAGGKGAIQTLADLPGGTILMAVLAIGLAAYGIFRLLLGIKGSGESGVKELVKRVARIASAIGYAFLTYTCIQALGLASGGGGSSKKTYLGEVLASDGGPWLAILGGLAVVGAGLYQISKGVTNAPSERLNTSEMSANLRIWIIRLGRLGLIARGVVFAIIGGFLVKAGLAVNAAAAKTTGGALREIAQQDYGAILLTAMALGLGAYGLYMIASTRYRNITIS